MNLTFHQFCELKPLVSAVYELEALIKQKTGLTLNEAMALCCLKSGAMVQSRLGEELHMGATRTSRLVSSLMDQHFLTSTPDQQDRRKNILTLTMKGAQAADRLKQLESTLFPMTVLKEVEPWLST